MITFAHVINSQLKLWVKKPSYCGRGYLGDSYYWYYLFIVYRKKANRELVQEFQLDKEDLENEYSRFVQEYDELKFKVTNDSLGVLLEQEQLKTQRLLEELRTVKSSNATEIRRLKKELATLRKVMVGYINQIDSLNKLAAQQKQVIAEVTQKYNQASQQISNLSEEKKIWIRRWR